MRKWWVEFTYGDRDDWVTVGDYYSESPEGAIEKALQDKPEEAAHYLFWEKSEVRVESSSRNVHEVGEGGVESSPEVMAKGPDLIEGVDFYPA